MIRSTSSFRIEEYKRQDMRICVLWSLCSLETCQSSGQDRAGVKLNMIMATNKSHISRKTTHDRCDFLQLRTETICYLQNFNLWRDRFGNEREKRYKTVWVCIWDRLGSTDTAVVK